MNELLAHPVFALALILGVCGGIALVLTETLSRRGPLVLPVYGVLLVSLGVLLSRYSALSFSARLGAAFCGFAVAALMHYVAIGIAADRDRRAHGFTDRLPFAGHLWRLSLLFGLGLIACAGVAFVAA